jgi:protoporphyrinogen oxidase
MKKIVTETLIIGAGPAGLAAAMELSKKGKQFIVIERQATVGGLSKTYEFREGNLLFRTDNGPHRFFSKNQYLYDFIEELLSERWIQVKRQTRQYIEGKFYDYPVNALQALKNVGFVRAVRMGLDYIVAKIRYGLFKHPIENFADYVHANFGKSLGQFNMINYTEKIWGISAKDIHVDWAGQRIKGLNVTALVKDMLSSLVRIKNSKKPKTLVDTFYYPELGTGLIYETIRSKLESQGYQIMCSTEPKKLVHTNGRVTSVICSSPEGEIEFVCKHLIESVPLKSFLDLLEPRPPQAVMNAQKLLTYRSQVYVFITLDRASVTADQWIYFPETTNPIGRMSEMRNFSPQMSPEGKTSLFIEFFCTKGDALWTMSEPALFDQTITYLVQHGFIQRNEVRSCYRIQMEDVYPVYDTHYQEYLTVIKKYLDTFKDFYYIGRPGRFRYNNQDHSLEMGILAARSIIEGKRYDIESIGTEKSYFESGTLHTNKA